MPRANNQGTAVVERDGRSLLVMTPDGAVERVTSAKAASALLTAWAKRNADAGAVNLLNVEWRGVKPPAVRS